MFPRLALILALGCLSLTPSTAFAQVPAASSASTAQVQSLLDKVAPSIVTIRVVLKIDVKAGGQSQSSESTMVTEGAVITPDGLVMMSNAPISSDVWRDMMGSDPDEKADFTVSPTEFKVVVGREEKEYSAFLAATDAKLGLAFIKIEDLGDRKLSAIDFSSPATAEIGQQLGAVTRLSKGYDYAPIFAQGQVKGVITKPRDAFLLATSIVSVGLPVFTLDGAPVGVMILLPAGLSADTPNSMDMMMRYYSGAAADRMGIFLIPVSTVQPIINEAIDQATKLAAERAKNPPAKPSTPAPAKAEAKPASEKVRRY